MVLVTELHRNIRTALGEAFVAHDTPCEGASAVVTGNTERRADGPLIMAAPPPSPSA